MERHQMSTTSKGRYFCKEYSKQRDYICALSYEDKKHGVNSMGTLSARNAYGELFWADENSPEGIPVICGHGGSMWLCRECNNRILEAQEKAITSGIAGGK